MFRARRGIVINSGTAPAIPPIQGLAGTPYWTNREIVQAEQVPESLIVLGGGAIGCELAQVFARFGTAVTVVEALPRLLSFEEPEASELIERIFTAEGIKVCTDAPAERVSHDGRALHRPPGRAAPLTAERLLVATGRRTDLAALGRGRDRAGPDGPDDPHRRLDARGGRGVGDRRRDRQGRVHPHVHVPGRHRGARHPGPGRRQAADYRAVPRVTFTDPEIGSVGPDRGAGAGGRAAGAHRPDPGALLGAGLDPQGGQRRVHQGRRGRRPVGAGRRHLGRAVRRRGAQRAAGRRPGRGAGGHAAQHALRLPDVLPRHRGRAGRTRVVMSRRPAVVAFDVIETLMSLEPLRDRLVASGQPPGLLEAWYTRTLRDGMALSVTGDYVAFADVAEAALRGLTHDTVSDEQVAAGHGGLRRAARLPRRAARAARG